jgi:hypothetical protein
VVAVVLLIALVLEELLVLAEQLLEQEITKAFQETQLPILVQVQAVAVETQVVSQAMAVQV